MTAMYELAVQFRQAAEQLGDLDLPDDVIADTLESLSGDLELKAANVALFARNLSATADAIKQAEAGMAARRIAIENRVKRLKDYLQNCMELAGVRKIEGPYLRLAIRENPAGVDVFDSAQLPTEYLRWPEPPPAVPDKVAIKNSIKAGVEVPGARLSYSKRIEISS
jgi:hypothetical protein